MKIALRVRFTRQIDFMILILLDTPFLFEIIVRCKFDRYRRLENTFVNGNTQNKIFCNKILGTRVFRKSKRGSAPSKLAKINV